MNTDEYKKKFQECVDFFEHDIKSLRTGRAAPSLVEDLKIEAYGSETPLKHVASISVSDPKTLVLQPWDRTLVKEVERAILSSDLHLTPAVDGAVVRISMPLMTEENRKQIVRQLREKAERCRINIRHQREKMRSEINAYADSKMMGDDEKFKLLKKIDELVQVYSEAVQATTDAKEKDIMSL